MAVLNQRKIDVERNIVKTQAQVRGYLVRTRSRKEANTNDPDPNDPDPSNTETKEPLPENTLEKSLSHPQDPAHTLPPDSDRDDPPPYTQMSMPMYPGLLTATSSPLDRKQQLSDNDYSPMSSHRPSPLPPRRGSRHDELSPVLGGIATEPDVKVNTITFRELSPYLLRLTANGTSRGLFKISFWYILARSDMAVILQWYKILAKKIGEQKGFSTKWDNFRFF